MFKNGVSGGLNPFSPIAAEVAYREGGEWLSQVIDYIWANYVYLKDFLQENFPELKIADLQGTYLAWVDFRPLGFGQDLIEDIIRNKAKLLFNQGYIFGEEGAGFQRINVACSRKLLKLGLERLKQAIDQVRFE